MNMWVYMCKCVCVCVCMIVTQKVLSLTKKEVS